MSKTQASPSASPTTSPITNAVRIVLNAEQQAIYDDVKHKVIHQISGESLYVGAAGTGKSTLIARVAKKVEKLCKDRDIHYYGVATISNAAVKRLKDLGVNQAKTLASLFTEYTMIPPLSDMVGELNNIKGPKASDILKKYQADLGFSGMVTPEVAKWIDAHVDNVRQGHDPHLDLGQLLYVLRIKKRTLDENHVYQKKAPPAEPSGVLILDEVSMVSEEVYDHARLYADIVFSFGDPNQLPPVKSKSIFERTTVTKALTQITRSDLVVIKQSQLALKGYPITQCVPAVKGKVDLEAIVAGKAFAITNSNKARVTLCSYARKSLWNYGPELAPQKGELLVMRKNDYKKARFHNNQIVRVVEATEGISWDDNHPVTLRPLEKGDDSSDDFRIRIYEEDCGFTKPNAIPVRFAYAVTAHTAQGNEADVSYINRDDTLNFGEHRINWLYTAITRAKKACYSFTYSDFNV